MYIIIHKNQSHAQYTCHHLLFIQESADAAAAANKLQYPQPVIIVRGSYTGNIKDAFLACEKDILCKVSPECSIIILFMTYYVFNIHYCCGCSNVFSLLEVFFLGIIPPKRAKLKHFLHMMHKTEDTAPDLY